MYFFCFQVHGPIIGGRLVTGILRHFDHLLDMSVVKRAKTFPRTWQEQEIEVIVPYKGCANKYGHCITKFAD